MSEEKTGVHILYLADLQRALSIYVKNRRRNVREIEDYHAAMNAITEKMKETDFSYNYAREATFECVKLILSIKRRKALTEYKIMVDNLKKEYNI